MSSTELNEILQAQRRFFDTGATRPVRFRVDMLRALGSALRARERRILDALEADMAKAPFEAFTGEIGLALNEIGHAGRHVRRWARARRVGTPVSSFYAISRVVPSPYGVCLIVSAWNYPVQLSLSPLAGALAAGNCAVVKPSEGSPNASAQVAELIADTFDPEYVAAVQGDAVTSRSLVALPFDYIFFTGSTAVGRQVMQVAAHNLVPVTLELGGKCPCIVDSDIDVDVAARRIVWGKFYNAGQSCVSPDYVVVHSSVRDAFVEAACRCVRRFYGPDPSQSPDFSRIIDHRHFDRLVAYLDGASVVFGGQHDRDQRYIAPTLLADVGWDDAIMQEEIFGPLLPVLVYDDLTHLIKILAQRPHPLALYFFSRSTANQKRIVEMVDFGGGCINDTLTHIVGPHLPHGGVGPSGMGRYHGKAGFDTFSYQKSILTRPLAFELPLRYPPFTRIASAIGRRLFG